MSREPTDDERRLLHELARVVPGLAVPPDWLRAVRVVALADGGMGSLELFVGEVRNPKRPIRIASEIEFLDDDGVTVLASLYVDCDHSPIELDVWKVDFGAVAKVPVTLPAARIPRPPD